MAATARANEPEAGVTGAGYDPTDFGLYASEYTEVLAQHGGLIKTGTRVITPPGCVAICQPTLPVMAGPQQVWIGRPTGEGDFPVQVWNANPSNRLKINKGDLVARLVIVRTAN